MIINQKDFKNNLYLFKILIAFYLIKELKKFKY
ncbi:MAG: hypothetical protein HLUCCX10_16025 [Algoriphagus marincola HL-49]|uniref:Uncharacterized protein n=1 Tax=Algoriphagus marincola HL-49 TaxID=1305737 RepID=A0A0P7X4X3_9BACT|nr:MAG: hypothetical protein HLUCCX10_16025 [Algoriphagus marincola HL-49]